MAESHDNNVNDVIAPNLLYLSIHAYIKRRGRPYIYVRIVLTVCKQPIINK